jgi:hypothetical protein
MTQKTNNPFRPSNSNAGTNANTRYGTSLNSRFGTSNVTCDIAPLGSAIIRFDLNGLGAPLRRLLGLEGEGAEREAVIQAIESDENLKYDLASRLDLAWHDYNLCGAMLVYPWQEGLRQAVATRLVDVAPGSTLVYLRALDPILVLNVLARARSHILLATSPPDLERPFLERDLAADDPRLIALACSNACAEVPFETPAQEAAPE